MARNRPSEWFSVLFTGAAGLVSGASLLLFVVTGVIWLVVHEQHWPGGYLPWMLSLSFLVFSVACYLSAASFMKQRDDARRELADHLDFVRYALEFDGIRSTELRQDPASSNCLIPFQYILKLKNCSPTEPVRFSVATAKFTVGNVSSADSASTDLLAGILLPGAERGFRGGLLSSVVIADAQGLGAGEYKILYGHPDGELRYRTVHKFRIEPLGFTPNGIPTGWQYLSVDGPTFERIQENDAA